jgi:hypothetical protein
MHVVQVGLKLKILHLLSAGITGVCHYVLFSNSF